MDRPFTPMNEQERREYYTKIYPQLSPELIEKIVTQRGKVLNKKQQERALQLYANGVHSVDICKLVQISNSSLSITRAAVPSFGESWAHIRRNRKKQIKSIVIRYLLGKLKEIKLTKTARLDSNGEPIYKDGKQAFMTVKIEETIIPPPKELLLYYLKTHFPEYAMPVVQEAAPVDNNTLPIEELQLKLASAIDKLA